MEKRTLLSLCTFKHKHKNDEHYRNYTIIYSLFHTILIRVTGLLGIIYSSIAYGVAI